jgi:hypothetical protein
MKETPDRWEKIEQLYHAALERDEAQRAGYLHEACGEDEALRREVESLLAQETQAGCWNLLRSSLRPICWRMKKVNL